MKYQHTLDIKGVRIGDLEEVLEKSREYAAAEIDWDAKILTITYAVGAFGAAADLWDLRGVVRELEESIEDYFYSWPGLGKPQPVKESS